MSIIDYTYFTTGITKIGSLSGINEENETRRTSVQELINTYEPEFMRVLIGNNFYITLLAKLAEEIPEEKYITFKNKVTPLIVKYVWFKNWQQSQIIETDSGDKSIMQAGLTPAENNNKAVSIYNSMVDDIELFYEWLIENWSDYGECQLSGWDYLNVFGL